MTIMLMTGIIPDSVNFVAECYYKTVTFSAEDFARRLSSFGHPSEDKDEALGDINNSDISDPDTGTASLSSTTSRSSSVCSQSSNCQVIRNHQTKTFQRRELSMPCYIKLTRCISMLFPYNHQTHCLTMRHFLLVPIPAFNFA